MKQAGAARLSPQTILVRVDGNHAMGLGHVMRCRALAEALIAQGHACIFLIASPGREVTATLEAAGIRVLAIAGQDDREASATLDHFARLGASALVIDGYHFDEAWRRHARSIAGPILTFADGAFRPAGADLVVDAASPVSDQPGQLFGPDYVLLRRELVEAARLPPLPIEERPAIMVTFGGSDPMDLTMPTVTALSAALPHTPLTVVIGPAVAEAAALATQLRALGAIIRVEIAPPGMGALMRESGLAVSAAGGTAGELAALGVPAILTIIAENQTAGAQACVEDGWCMAVDARDNSRAVDELVQATAQLWHDRDRRAGWAAKAKATVDPGGAERVAAALLSAIAGKRA
jgi:UDP-2,4-diacetamido-2,4,6-trideoxy-beta-L-altropyranose hydrolase